MHQWTQTSTKEQEVRVERVSLDPLHHSPKFPTNQNCPSCNFYRVLRAKTAEVEGNYYEKN